MFYLKSNFGGSRTLTFLPGSPVIPAGTRVGPYEDSLLTNPDLQIALQNGEINVYPVVDEAAKPAPKVEEPVKVEVKEEEPKVEEPAKEEPEVEEPSKEEEQPKKRTGRGNTRKTK